MFTRIVQAATNLFPLWSVLTAVLALAWPASFMWFGKDAITWGLGIIMLGMGLTLTWADFGRILQRPGSVFAGVGLQFLVMPSLGWSIGQLLGLSPEMAAGLVLVSCCPGGTASNVVAYLARANVALSVTMTAFSTLLAVVATPYLTAFLAGKMVPVDAWALLKSTFTVVILPVVSGAFINQFFRKQAEKVSAVFPLVSVVFIILIVGFILAVKRDSILEHWRVILASVVLLHTGGFLLGYFLALVLGLPEDARRTVSIEVGMQNSGLGAKLAATHFAPMVAVPSAVSAVVHCIFGSALAAFWRTRTPSGK
ncbi:MAG: bile acid:sodium symporter family protein [Opitutae bacterium]|nr:bile acid:sodium symporter family protein [Opitutae bacterium]MBT5378804.1 bile acid:sodium symporter family protein [Opitutae bacterium]MBT7853705.1 bile acid:sodium symporter family protein [Opitutae bacterium]